ncbi:MAG: outer membrane protein assembly factor BamB family protein [Ktedonobacteraceae bacterium]
MKRLRLLNTKSLVSLSALSLLLLLMLAGFVHFQANNAKAVGTGDANQATAQPHIIKTRQVGQDSNLKPGPLKYNGGPVMDSTSTTYAIFWEPPTLQDGKATQVSPNYNKLLQRYFNDVGGSNLYENNTQYYDSVQHIVNSSALGGMWVDTSAYPASNCTDTATPDGCMSDTLIQSEITKAMSTNGWTAGLTHMFFVYTAWGEGSCLTSGSCAFTNYCAYHSDFMVSGQPVIYANMPYAGTNLTVCGVPSSPNGDFDADSTINLSSQEQMGAITDPELNGWYDDNGNEIGDKCAWNFAGPNFDGGLANVAWEGHFYRVQQEWSNVFNACVIQGQQGTVFASSSNGSLCALDTNDGFQRWCYQTRGNQASSPTLANQLVYFGTNNGYVYAVNKEGSRIWRYQTDSTSVTSSPTVANGVVYVAATSLYALNASNGALLWSDTFSTGASSSPTVINGVIYIVEGDGNLYALNANDGTQIWHYQIGMSGNATAPTVSNGVVYVGSSNNSLYALNSTDGSLLWQYQTSGSINSSAAVSNGIVYIGSEDGTMYALKAKNGSLLWHYQTGNAIFSSPAVANGMVYFGSNDTYVYALNASNGSLVWQYSTGGKVVSSPTLLYGIVYIGSEDAYVYALNANNGILSWHSKMSSGVDTTPTVDLRTLAL